MLFKCSGTFGNPTVSGLHLTNVRDNTSAARAIGRICGHSKIDGSEESSLKL